MGVVPVPAGADDGHGVGGAGLTAGLTSGLTAPADNHRHALCAVLRAGLEPPLPRRERLGAFCRLGLERLVLVLVLVLVPVVVTVGEVVR